MNASARRRALAEHGNLELALDLVEPSAPAERARQIREVRMARPVTGRVLVPLVGRPSLLDSVTIRPGPAVRWRDAAAAHAASTALERAWRDVGGEGERHPDDGVALGCADSRDVGGSSIHLPVYLAAVARFTDAPMTHNILATGCFEAPLDGVSDKLALHRRALERLGVEGLMYASAGHELAAPELTRVRDHDHARRLAFVIDPWHPAAPVRRLHLHCGAEKADPPRQWADVVPMALPPRLGAVDLPNACERFLQALAGADRAELSIAGPQPLSAALGIAARNGRACVRIVDARGRAMWHSSAPSGRVEAAASEEARIVVGSTGRVIPRGWEHYRVPDVVSEHEMARIVGDFLRRHGAVRTLHLAFATTLPVAWAIAGMRKNLGTTRYYHFQAGDYVPWFEEQHGEIRPCDDSRQSRPGTRR